MQRREFLQLFAGAVVLALRFAGAVVLALWFAPSALAENWREFLWRVPGRDPLHGMTDTQAVQKLASGGMIPPDALNALLNLVGQGVFRVDSIPHNFFFTRMLFGFGIIAPNTRALTDEWPDTATRRVKVYEYEDKKTHISYVLIRPDVCGNWSLRIITAQGVCVQDDTKCDPSCTQLRINQTR